MKKDKKRKIRKILLAIVSLMIIIGVVVFIYFYFFKKDNPTPKKKTKVTTTKKIEKKLKIVDLDSDSRPYAVMINNISTVWGYQTGIQDAYLVYEIIVEGGYTRLMAVFKDQNLERIGSVRSSRHYFLDYALENDAIYVHFGWSPQAQSDMKTLGVDNINFLAYGQGYTRDYSLGLSSEHTAYTSTDKIMAGADYYKYSKKSNDELLLNYSVDELDLSQKQDSQVANNVFIGYSSSRSTGYQYDSVNKVYKRYQNQQEHTDFSTKKQYTAKNIIVYQVSNHTIAGDNKNRQDINNLGSGDGYYISDGYAIPITWHKQTRSSKTIYRYLDGSELIVNDGNTFIQIQPTGQTLTIE